MKAKEYLQNVRRIADKINNKQLQLLNLWDMARSITTTMSDIGGSGQGGADQMAETVSKIVDLENEISGDIDQYVEMKLEAIQMINLLQNETHSSLLFRRYINLEEWPEIAEKMKYTRQSLMNKHRQALSDFQEILDGWKR